MTFDQTTRLGHQKLHTTYPLTFEKHNCPFLRTKFLWNTQSLGILKQKFPNIPVLALTATATASVKEDVVQALGLVNCVVFRQSFNRPNLW